MKFIYPKILISLIFAFTLSIANAKGTTTIEIPKTEVKPEITPTAAPDETEKSILAKVNEWLGEILFFDCAGGSIKVDNVDIDGKLVDPTQPTKTVPIKFLILFLAFGSIFFTFMYRFVNIRMFKHAIDITRGKYDNPDDKGDVTHFKALTSALSATIGLGNIAGVAIAIQMGGPGAVFWMLLISIFGMSAKFSSATLAQFYRKENYDGSISGGPMYYLELGYKNKGKVLSTFGLILGITYAICLMGGSIGGGNMFQGNQSLAAVSYSLKDLGVSSEFVDSTTFKYIFGIILAGLSAAVIIGGIKRIGNATAAVVPIMCGIYILASMVIIGYNIDKLGSTLELIYTSAFSAQAAFGGFFGVMLMGIQRATFSNEAGLGSASIAHAASKTNEPVREGFVAMMGPVIDTLVVCFMTALVVIITGKWNATIDSTGATLQKGSVMTMEAFGTNISWFPYILTLCILLFAYSTIISWCYYGERGWIYLADKVTNNKGLQSVVIFRVVFIFFVFYGVISNNADVVDFSDLMILSMAFPNILGSLLLTPFVWQKTKDYMRRFKAGEFKEFK